VAHGKNHEARLLLRTVKHSPGGAAGGAPMVAQLGGTGKNRRSERWRSKGGIGESRISLSGVPHNTHII
jgi:hypothetical protein